MNHGNTPQPPTPLNEQQTREWLDYNSAPIVARAKEIAEALVATIQVHPTIDDEETFGEVAENIRMARSLIRTAEDRRQEEKKPYLNGGRVVDAWFADALKPLDRAIVPVQTAMNVYGERKLAAERAAAEKRRKEAEQEAARRLKAAQKAMAKNAPDVDAQMASAQHAAEQAQQATDRVNAPSADLTRSRGIYGATASVRTTWSWRVVDPALIPREYLMIDGAKIETAKRQRDAQGAPTAEIPGIRWVPEHKVGVR